MLQETEIVNMAKEISDKMSKELTTITDRIQTTLREKMEEAITELHEKVNEILTQAKDSVEELGKLTTKICDIAEKERTTATPYWNALNQEPVGPPVRVDPWVRAKESARVRQFL